MLRRICSGGCVLLPGLVFVLTEMSGSKMEGGGACVLIVG